MHRHKHYLHNLAGKMKKHPIFALLIFLCASCNLLNYDKCLDPDCEYSTEFRFNLTDSLGNDLLFGDSSDLILSDISIDDKDGFSYSIFEVNFVQEKVLIVSLNGTLEEYVLSIKSDTIDTFKANFYETQEECCGKTYWIDTVQFNKIESFIPDQNIGSMHLIIK